MPVTTGNGPRVLLVSTMRSSFIQEDIDMLGRHFSLDLLIGSGAGMALRVFVAAMRSDVSICWFASAYSFFMVLGARLTGKKPVIILGGGAETAKERDLNY
jgi:hypothetical protein